MSERPEHRLPSMRPIHVTEFVTLDGIMEAPGGEPGHPHSGWVIDHHTPEQGEWKTRELLEADALLLGRVTYESFAGAWPEREGPMADAINAMAKFVVSSTLTDPGWSNVHVLAGDPIAAVRALKAGEGGPIQVPGSCTLVHALLEAGLVDQLTLMTFPVTVGSGRRVFPDSEQRTAWVPVSTEAFESGVSVTVYRPAGDGR